MAPLTLLATLVSILAVSTSVTAQSGTGTGTGLPIPSATIGAPFLNTTLPSITPGPPPSTLTTAPQGTGTGTGFAVPTGYAKRLEMRGLKPVRKEKKKQRAARWW